MIAKKIEAEDILTSHLRTRPPDFEKQSQKIAYFISIPMVYFIST